jgi:hypothetical protein
LRAAGARKISIDAALTAIEARLPWRLGGLAAAKSRSDEDGLACNFSFMTETTPCPGCGANLPPTEGPVHAYMTSSPACWAAFGRVLEAEYSMPELMPIHRLSVDAYAVQHPGDPTDRRAVQSVGLHLARLRRQLEHPTPPAETNEIMQGFAARKATLIYLPPPKTFSITVADVAPYAGTAQHGEKTLAWARAAWRDWSAHHDYVRQWASRTEV